MVELLQMWALVEVLGLVCLPLTVTVFHNLPDRGWAFSKALGMALLAFLVWFPLMCLRFLPYNQHAIIVAALVLLVCNVIGLLRIRHALVKIIRLNRAYILAVEALFLGMVFLMGWLRSFNPDIRSYEMFMDEGFIAAIMRSPHLPPNDMWFAGYPINYYYYAHFTLATLAKLLGQSPSIDFNTGICIFFGLTAACLFGITCNIVTWARYLRGRANAGPDAVVERPDSIHPSLFRAVPYGLLTMLMGLVLGNLDATQTWWQSHGEWATYDWWKPSRVIDKTINEFPAFSFLLSCFHAHVLALAFTIMAMGLAFNLLLEPDGQGLFVFGRGWRLLLTLGMTALIIGGLFTMNGWDYPTYMGLALICIALQQWLAYRSRLSMGLVLDIFAAGASLVALSFILYAPFYLSFISPSQGIGIVGATDRTPLSDELLIYGLFAFVFLSLLLASVSKRSLAEPAQKPQRQASADATGVQTGRSTWLTPGLGAILLIPIALLLILVFAQNSATFVFAASIAILGVVLLWYNLANRAHAFTLLLGSIAFGLVAVCEVFFLKDVFAGNFPRMNTVFKFYFQAWALLSITSGVGLFFILDSFRSMKATSSRLRLVQGSVKGLWGLGLLALLLASSAYPLAAPAARYARFNASTNQYYLQRSNSLDGLTYLQSDPANPGDYAAIRWLNANVQGDPVIVEAIGDDYSNYARISAFTGLPTLMGWVGHEYQWRVNWLNKGANAVEFNRRSSDVDLIYTSPDPKVVLSVMARYHAEYLYVGALEYAKYPTANLRRFSAFMQVVYNAGGVTIYKVR
jgi:YYY domain-containing protein